MDYNDFHEVINWEAVKEVLFIPKDNPTFFTIILNSGKVLTIGHDTSKYKA